MKTTYRKSLLSVAALAFAVACALALSACGSAGSASGPFTGMQPRDAAEMEPFTSKALEIGIARQAALTSDVEEGEQSAVVADDFSKANNAYREGVYDKALQLYEAVLEKYPMHFGANVNLVLAQLQQGRNEDALTQALLCEYLFGEETGCALNVQAAGTACGFGEDAIDDAINTMDTYHSSDISVNPSADFAYNSLWNRIETVLYEAAKGDGANLSDLQVKYEVLVAEADELVTRNSDDADAAALRAYLQAVGEQLGFVDASADAAAA